MQLNCGYLTIELGLYLINLICQFSCASLFDGKFDSGRIWHLVGYMSREQQDVQSTYNIPVELIELIKIISRAINAIKKINRSTAL